VDLPLATETERNTQCQFNLLLVNTQSSHTHSQPLDTV